MENFNKKLQRYTGYFISGLFIALILNIAPSQIEILVAAKILSNEISKILIFINLITPILIAVYKETWLLKELIYNIGYCVGLIFYFKSGLFSISLINCILIISYSLSIIILVIRKFG
jgi:hypothetical protein